MHIIMNIRGPVHVWILRWLGTLFYLLAAHPVLCLRTIPRIYDPGSDEFMYHGKCLTNMYGHADGSCYVDCYNGYVGDSCELKTGNHL